MKRLLLISVAPIVCQSDQDGASLRVHELLIALASQYRVTYVCLSTLPDFQYASDFCIRNGITLIHSKARYLYLRLMLLSLLPRKAISSQSCPHPAFPTKDALVIYEGIHSLVYYPRLLYTNPSIVNFVDSQALTYFRLLKGSLHTPLTLLRTLILCLYFHLVECLWSNKLDTISTVSPDDANFLTKLQYKNVFTIPNGVRVDHYPFLPLPPKTREQRMLFYGRLSNQATAHAAATLIKDFQSASTHFPRYSLSVAGSNPSESLLSIITQAKVKLYHSPANILPIIYDHDIVVAIYSLNCGIKNTVLQALSAGRLCIISSNIALPIGAIHLVHCIIASDILTALKLVSSLHFDQISEIARRGSQLVNESFSWEAQAQHNVAAISK